MEDELAVKMDGSTYTGAPSVGELSAEFRRQKQAKSPPLAFEKTPNDTITSPPQQEQSQQKQGLDSSGFGMAAMSQQTMQRPHEEVPDLQVVVDQQAAAIQLLHDAFAAERQSWNVEREKLYYRIAQLEKLLKTGEGYSPAKSPVLSPFSGSNLTSPQSKATGRLPSIAEDENITPLSQRRENAPQSIDISINSPEADTSVSFADEATPSSLKVEEIPPAPSHTAAPQLSPLPFKNRMEAGHTPLKAPRPPTPPPHKDALAVDGVDDTPTRNNTHINGFLTRSNDEDEDKALKGPLNMPELPHKPDESNFTLDMLSRKLEQIEKNPEESNSRPMVFAQPSPGLASPAEPTSPNTRDR